MKRLINISIIGTILFLCGNLSYAAVLQEESQLYSIDVAGNPIVSSTPISGSFLWDPDGAYSYFKTTGYIDTSSAMVYVIGGSLGTAASQISFTTSDPYLTVYYSGNDELTSWARVQLIDTTANTIIFEKYNFYPTQVSGLAVFPTIPSHVYTINASIECGGLDGARAVIGIPEPEIASLFSLCIVALAFLKRLIATKMRYLV